MNKCKLCGGTCSEVGGGRYQCDFCGATFSANDFASSRSSGKGAKESVGGTNLGADIYERNVNGVLEITMVEKSQAKRS